MSCQRWSQRRVAWVKFRCGHGGWMWDDWFGSFSPRKVAETSLLSALKFLPKPVYLGFDLTLPFYLNPPNVIRRKGITNSCYMHTLLHSDLNP